MSGIHTNRGVNVLPTVGRPSGATGIQHLGGDARTPRRYVSQSRLWTKFGGSYYDWLTEPAPPPANVQISQERGIMRRVMGRIFGRVN